jgi:hypothetical protein
MENGKWKSGVVLFGDNYPICKALKMENPFRRSCATPRERKWKRGASGSPGKPIGRWQFVGVFRFNPLVGRNLPQAGGLVVSIFQIQFSID